MVVFTRSGTMEQLECRGRKAREECVWGPRAVGRVYVFQGQSVL